MVNKHFNFGVILCVSILAFVLVNGNMECDSFFENSGGNYLAHYKLGDIFAGFGQIFNAVHRSEIIQKRLNAKILNFVELLLVTKKIQLELKAADESKFNRTMEELCRESSPNEPWLKSILRAAVEFRTMLAPIMNGIEFETNVSPRLG